MTQSVACAQKTVNAHFYFNESEITFTLISHLYLSDTNTVVFTPFRKIALLTMQPDRKINFTRIYEETIKLL